MRGRSVNCAVKHPFLISLYSPLSPRKIRPSEGLNSSFLFAVSRMPKKFVSMIVLKLDAIISQSLRPPPNTVHFL